MAGLGSWVGKLQVTIHRIQSEIDALKAKTADIGSLTASRVGIGTNAPSSGLLIVGNISLQGEFETLKSTNAGAVSLYEIATTNGWRIQVVGTNLEFQRLDRGAYSPIVTLSSTGLITRPK